MAQKPKTLRLAKAGQPVRQLDNPESFLVGLAETFEAEIAEYEHDRVRGASLPYAEIIDAVEHILAAIGKDRAPVGWLALKVGDYLEAKYRAMSEGGPDVPVRKGRDIISMAPLELKELRLRQLDTMRKSTKDNLYRRVYGLGYRDEYASWELEGGELVKKG